MKLLAIAAGVLAALGATSAAAAAAPSVPQGYSIRTFATGGSATNPDDVARLGREIFIGYQNGTSADGTGGSSTVVAYLPTGAVAGRWTIPGRVDGLGGDPAHERVIATVNEDANSSLYTISRKGELRHYTYAPNPASLSGGGTDAVTVVGHRVLISASNPSPTTPGGSVFAGPAAYSASIPAHGELVKLTPVFADNATATDGVTGKVATLNLSDPDSNATVAHSSPRFGGDFVLDSQGDSELVFDRFHGRHTLTRLSLTSADGAPQVDDIRWADASQGSLLVVDQKADTVYVITGPFHAGTALTSIPSGGPMAGVLGTINLFTGKVEAFATGFSSPKGLLYLPTHTFPSSGKGGQGAKSPKSSKHHKK